MLQCIEYLQLQYLWTFGVDCTNFEMLPLILEWKSISHHVEIATIALSNRDYYFAFYT